MDTKTDFSTVKHFNNRTIATLPPLVTESQVIGNAFALHTAIKMFFKQKQFSEANAALDLLISMKVVRSPSGEITDLKMRRNGITPDFISVDGGEGGTGAAPLEFSNSVGTPFKEGLVFVHDCLVGFNLRKEIKIISAGKIITAFDMYRAFALGADVCYSARAMMLAIGCIQALECNKNTCPTGVATQDKELVAGLNVKDKKERVASYHHQTVEAFVELLAASGLKNSSQIERRQISRRITMKEVLRYDEIYPPVKPGCLLAESTVPKEILLDWKEADPGQFVPKRFDPEVIA